MVAAGDSLVIRLRLSDERCIDDGTEIGADFDAVFDARRVRRTSFTDGDT